MNPLLFTIIALLTIAKPVFGQDETIIQRRIENMRQIQLSNGDMLRMLEPRPLSWDYGGFLNYRYDHYKDDDNDAASRDTLEYTHSADLRIWLKTLYKVQNSPEEYGAYLRIKDQLTIIKEPSDINKSFDNRGPKVDMAYLSFTRKPFSIEAGRRFFKLGSGIALSNTADGAELSTKMKDLSIRTMALHTMPHESNIDFSVPGADKKSKRVFWGLETSYTLRDKHRIYTYTLLQRDQSDEDPVDATHDYSYNSNYLGFGLEGALIPRSRYWFEAIYETGKSHIYATAEKKDIRAHALDIGLSYGPPIYTSPRFSIEYAYGSGDEDRTSVTNTLGGNTVGRDRNFLYFGFLNSGYALSPLLSNIHFYRFGFIFSPFENSTALKKLDMGIDYYQFYKDKESGGIYDTDATLTEKHIGQEIDLTITYKIFSDLSTTLEYGYFIPGKAYPKSTNNNSEYLSLSLRLNF